MAGGVYEEIIESGVVTQKSYVGGVLVHSKTGTTEQVRYLHRDHLGSVEAITDESGNRVERLAFSPFGQRRMEDWSDGGAYSQTTTRGFTDHEHLDDFDLIDMRGRVYDPTIGRFLSADPFVQAPDNTQSYNRYSYVFNNPLSYVDPTGYENDYYCEALDTCGSGLDDGGSDFDWDSDPFGGVGIRNLFSDFQMAEAIAGPIHRHHVSIASNRSAVAQRNSNPFDNPIEGQQVAGLDVGLKVNADGDVILCVGSDACDDSSNVRNATTAEILTTGADFVPWGKVLSPLKVIKFKRWKVGNAIDKALPDGSNPSWDIVRSRYWKNRAALSSGEFSKDNLKRMRRGQAPLDYNPRTGNFEPRELHHVVPQRAGGSNNPLNLRELTPDQHGAVDPFRHTVPTTRGIQ